MTGPPNTFNQMPHALPEQGILRRLSDEKTKYMPKPGGAVMFQKQAMDAFWTDPSGFEAMTVPLVVMKAVPEHNAACAACAVCYMLQIVDGIKSPQE